MITPRFTCSQTEISVTVSMYCPSIRAADVEIHVDEALVTVHVNPYFLRLNFSRSLLEDDDSAAQYDPSSGYLVVTLTKATPGEVFEDLDLLSKLLSPRRELVKDNPSIEVLESEISAKVAGLSLDAENEGADAVTEAAEDEWHTLQEVPDEVPTLKSTTSYGFLDLHRGYLHNASQTENDINELGDDAETCSLEERRARRTAHEDAKWDEEHYIADFMDDDLIKDLLLWTHPHVSDADVSFTEEENDRMLRLPRKEYLAKPYQRHALYLTLVTILFAYAYDSRSTQHDPTSESAWTVCNLVPAFCALDPPRVNPSVEGRKDFSPDELQEALVPSYRRSLAFPLYRSFAFSEKCRMDTCLLLQRGKRTVLRCLLELKDILDHHDVFYIYSKIWVDDFCLWVQADSDDAVLQKLGKVLMQTTIDKASIGWNLEELEKTALESLDRETDSDDE